MKEYWTRLRDRYEHGSPCISFGDAEIIGVDLSEEMLVKARKNISQAMFIRRDCSRPLSDLGKFDLLFSVPVQTSLPDRREVRFTIKV